MFDDVMKLAGGLAALMIGVAVVSCLVELADAYLPDECGWAEQYAPQCCRDHADRYTKGGTEQQRYFADRLWYWCMIFDGVPEPMAEQLFRAARAFGGYACAPGARGCWRYPHIEPANPAPACYGGIVRQPVNHTNRRQ
jgi:hypothetical protein